MLKLSVTFPSSLAEILMCQLFLHVIWHCHGNRILTCRLTQISFFFDRILQFFFPVFLNSLAELVLLYIQLSFSTNFEQITLFFDFPEKNRIWWMLRRRVTSYKKNAIATKNHLIMKRCKILLIYLIRTNTRWYPVALPPGLRRCGYEFDCNSVGLL